MSNELSSTTNASPQAAPEKLVLVVRGLGNPFSFKNKKRAILRPGAKWPTLITEPKAKQWMNHAIQGFVSQLRSLCRTGGFGTTAECWKRFATASLPQDDNWQVLEIGSVRTRLVPKGQEGAVVEIERI